MKVAVIITTCDKYSGYLSDAIASVRNQTIDVELHIIDGNGRTVGAAANEGIFQHVTLGTQYVMRLDADDYLHEKCCEIMADYLDRHPGIAAVYSDHWVTGDGALERVEYAPMPPHPACMLMRRGTFADIGGYEEDLEFQEGTEFYYRLTKQHKLAHITLPLWYYRAHDQQMSNAHNEKMRIRHDIKSKHGEEPKILAVIPARGNSKGIPRKNLRLLAGVPLVSHAIRMAKKCRHDMLIVVSTEDEEIAAVAGREGCDVIMRPDELSEDDVSTISVVKHAMEHMDKAEKWRADIVVSIQPTDPFTPPEALDAAIQGVIDGFDSMVSVAEIHGTHPYRAYWVTKTGMLDPCFPGFSEKFLQRQDRPPAYGFTGGFYVRKRHLLEKWTGDGFAIGAHPHAVIVTQEAGIDIDTPLDLLLAETVMKMREQ